MLPSKADEPTLGDYLQMRVAGTDAPLADRLKVADDGG
jgi:hypothetical protein